MLHNFSSLEQYKDGLVERCTRCGLKMFFPPDTPNHKYLEYHIRQALQPNDPRYHIEYPQ